LHKQEHKQICVFLAKNVSQMEPRQHCFTLFRLQGLFIVGKLGQLSYSMHKGISFHKCLGTDKKYSG
jgi:hypothetical protein